MAITVLYIFKQCLLSLAHHFSNILNLRLPKTQKKTYRVSKDISPPDIGRRCLTSKAVEAINQGEKNYFCFGNEKLNSLNLSPVSV